MIRIAIRAPGGGGEVREFQQTSVRIGRKLENDIVLDDANVSGFHGEIRTSREGLVYEDLASTNGSFLRRHHHVLRLDEQGPRRLVLMAGDELLFGEPTAPLVLAAEFVAEAAAGERAGDTNIELATTLDAADSGVLRGWSVGFDQSALLRLHQFSECTLTEHDLDAILMHFADGVLDLFAKADRISVYLQREGDEYFPVLSRNRRGACPYERVSRTLKRLVLESGQAVVFAASDRELSDASSLRKSNISVGLCAPLRDGEHIFGFAQVDTRGKLVPFDERDLQVFAVFSRQLALSVSNLQLNQGLRVTVSNLERAREEMEKLAFEDPLTGLANRRLFRDRLEQAMRMRRRSGRQLAVLYVDLDNFKRINDSLGHDAGDELLVVVGKRLSQCVRAPDTVARLGGDEFALMLPEVSGAEGALLVAEKILAALREPVALLSERVIVTTSVGITLAPDDATDAETLLKNADMALYRAKNQGRDHAQFFSEELKHDAALRLSLEGELRHALEAGELVLHYQPVWRLGEARPQAAEVLLRWQHPKRGLLFPDAFIRLAEESGLVVPIGEWVLRETCRQLERIRTHGATPFTLSLNLSPRQLLRGSLTDAWDNIFAETGADASALQVEITETMLMENLPESRRTLDHLRALGMSVAIDDFGTGYSSLGYLKELPIDTLKIDQSFVQGIEKGGSEAEIASAIIAMGHKLGLCVVGEGIETEAQLEFLRANDCDLGQGFFLGSPQAFDLEWLDPGAPGGSKRAL